MEQREEGKRKKDGSFESSVESGTIERRGRRKNWIMYRQNWKLIKDSIGGGGGEGRGEKEERGGERIVSVVVAVRWSRQEHADRERCQNGRVVSWIVF